MVFYIVYIYGLCCQAQKALLEAEKEIEKKNEETSQNKQLIADLEKQISELTQEKTNLETEIKTSKDAEATVR